MLGNPNLSCWLDQHDVIISVSMPEWDEFALTNAGAKVTSDKVIGRNLKSFVMGFMTLMWLESVLELARSKNVEIESTYRCDAPSEKRYMKMSVSPQPYGQLYIVYHFLQTKPIVPAIHFNYAEPIDSLYMERCSICNRIQLNGVWYEPEAAFQKGLVEDSCSLPVNYTVCHECMFQLHNLRYHFT
ncbi:MAG: hypothetical protein KDF65_03975 [Anaerolineae bacterium]|nr:hypothetical protein [Anaerolineae bacterium]